MQTLSGNEMGVFPLSNSTFFLSDIMQETIAEWWKKKSYTKSATSGVGSIFQGLSSANWNLENKVYFLFLLVYCRESSCGFAFIYLKKLRRCTPVYHRKTACTHAELCLFTCLCMRTCMNVFKSRMLPHTPSFPRVTVLSRKCLYPIVLKRSFIHQSIHSNVHARHSFLWLSMFYSYTQ